MFNTFNMGVGMAVIVAPEDAENALRVLGEGYVLGECVSGGGVELW